MRAYQRKQFAAASKGAPAAAAPEPELELTARIERKYKAAQIVETGIQVCSRPCTLAPSVLSTHYNQPLHVPRSPSSAAHSRAQQSDCLQLMVATCR